MAQIVPESFNYLRALTDTARKKYATEDLNKISIAVNAGALETALDFIETHSAIRELEIEAPKEDLKRLKDSLINSGKVILAADKFAALPLSYPAEKRVPYLEAYLEARKQF